MNIILRTGGGRGVYEISGQLANLIPNDLVGRDLLIRLTPRFDYTLGLKLHLQGGKHRVVLDGAGIHIQKQLASILLLPSPIRDPSNTGVDDKVLYTNKYVIDSIEIKELILTEQTAIILPGGVTCKNKNNAVVLDFALRFNRISALWAQRDKFPSAVTQLLAEHESLVMLGGPLGTRSERLVQELQSTLQKSLKKDFDNNMDPLKTLDTIPFSLAVALCTKPFLILTGQSGTGKSRSAIELSTAFDYGPILPKEIKQSRVAPATNMVFVSVGADWTDQRQLLGYTNPFGPIRQTERGETHLTYELTDVLKLMLRAVHPDYQQIPHFIILDEMNLSHVERYFSAFLSVMEATRSSEGSRFELLKKEDVNLIKQVLEYQQICPMEIEAAEWLLNNNCGLPFPSNLFVIGTVNVDETTYMFSPKVLDRAFVIELKSVEPRIYLEGSVPEEEKINGSIGAKIFAEAIERRRNREWQTPSELLSQVREQLGQGEISHLLNMTLLALNGSYKLLDPVGFGFGYRVVNEVLQYLLTFLEAQKALSNNDEDAMSMKDLWLQELDKAILMKILPKIHGNRRQLGDSLLALADFYNAVEGAGYTLGTSQSIRILEDESLEKPLKRSEIKARQLHHMLQASGYTTFIS